MPPLRTSRSRYFYPRPPRGGRPAWRLPGGSRCGISIHALREEGDPESGGSTVQTVGFLSTPSARRATFMAMLSCFSAVDFYPRPPRGGRQAQLRTMAQNLAISIHALREEGDADDQERVIVFLNFYPRPPRGGRPPTSYRPDMAGVISIHALREEGDSEVADISPTNSHFYPRPPRGGRPPQLEPTMC